MGKRSTLARCPLLWCSVPADVLHDAAMRTVAIARDASRCKFVPSARSIWFGSRQCAGRGPWSGGNSNGEMTLDDWDLDAAQDAAQDAGHRLVALSTSFS